MKILNVNITDKVAVYSQRGGAIVCDNKNHYQIKFTFDAEWSGHSTKTARFVYNGGYYDVSFTGDTVTVPELRNATSLSVGVYAGDLSTTTPAVIPCTLSILSLTDTPSEDSDRDFANEAKEAADRAEAAAATAAQDFAELAAQQMLGGIVQTSGDSETQVMSQKATTDLAKDILSQINGTADTSEITWELGAITSASGDYDSTTRMRTNKIEIGKAIFPYVFGNADIACYFYSGDTILKDAYLGWRKKITPAQFDVSDATHFRLVARYPDDAKITNVEALSNCIKWGSLSDSVFSGGIEGITKDVAELENKLNATADRLNGWVTSEEKLAKSDFAYYKFINVQGELQDAGTPRAATVKYIPIVEGLTTLEVIDGWQYNIAVYDTSRVLFSQSTYADTTFIAPINGYIRFTLVKDSGLEFTIEDAINAVRVTQLRGELAKVVELVALDEQFTEADFEYHKWVDYSNNILDTENERAACIRHTAIQEGTSISVASGWKYNLLLLDTNYNVISYTPYGTTPFVSSATGFIRFTVLKADDSAFTLEEAVNALSVTHKEGALDRELSKLSLSVDNLKQDVRAIQNNGASVTPLNLHSTPRNKGVLNAIKRARQLSDFEWAPVADVIRISVETSDTYEHTDLFQDKFTADKKYTGVPYSATNHNAQRYGYDRMFLGYIPLETYMSAVRASGSVIYKESYYDSRNNGTFYGAICSSFVCYALGLEPCFTSHMANIPGMIHQGKLVNDSGARFDVSTLELADVILWSGEHVAMITDIIKDEDGNVKIIEVTETTKYGNTNSALLGSEYGALTRRKGWLVEDFFKWFKEFSVYRYDNIAEVEYEFSPYSPMKDECDMKPTLDFPCLPYMGNKFIYRKGYIPNSKLLAPANGFSHVRVLKDGVPFNSDGTGGLYEKQDEVSIGFTNTGFYEAYLCRATDGVETYKSSSCQWRVSDAAISISKNNNAVTFTIVTDGHDVPKAVGFTSKGTYPEYPWTKINAADMTESVDAEGKHTYIFTLTEPTWAGSYCKVAFNNKYGTWYSDTLTY